MSLLTAPPRPLFVPYTERRWTIAEFERLIGAGFFMEGGPEYLWDGKIVTPMSEYEPHIIALDSLLEQLRARLSPADWWVRQDHPLWLREHYMPEPDIVVARGSLRDYAGRRPVPTDVALLVEVGDASYPFDAGKKLRQYATARIAPYWIVHLEARRVEVYTNPQGADETATYDPPVFYNLGDSVPLGLVRVVGEAEVVYPPIPVLEILGDAIGGQS
jgi:hypothetical protein